MVDLQTSRPGQAVLNCFEQLQRIASSTPKSLFNKKFILDILQKLGTQVITFHNALVQGCLKGYSNTSSYMLHCLKSVAAKEETTSQERTPPRALLTHQESVIIIFDTDLIELGAW
jgi:hypothetical protein